MTMPVGTPTNWWRWGAQDELGATNLLGPQSVLRGAAAIKTGVTVSLAHPLALQAAENNPFPASRVMKQRTHVAGGAATDVISVDYHGLATTHVDALCHVWDSYGTYNGHDPAEVISNDGARWGDVTVWREGLITRGVLLDVCRARGVDCVELDAPVTGAELAELSSGLDVRSGDAVVVYCGRERWDDREEHAWGAQRIHDGATPRPGLHSSCVGFFRESDAAILVWDMLDALPVDPPVAWPVHRAIHDLGMALVDNARLGPLAEQCRATGVSEFALVVAPLVVPGGTGSPVNPIAIF
jgi:kynurenine formamidase